MTPIILHHGIFGFARLKVGFLQLPYFGGIDAAIRRRGHAVHTARVPPAASIAVRAEALKTSIETWLDSLGQSGRRVVIVAHSMGGLDSRYMISRLGMADRVAALVTIATPHRGSPVADLLMGAPGMDRVVEAARSVRLDLGGGHDLTTESCARFNNDIPDAPGVRYCSIATECPPQSVPAFLEPAYRFIEKSEGPNDGLVSSRSAAWGELLDTWPVNHFHAVNMRFLGGFGVNVGDVTPRYMQMLDRLEAAGAL